VVPAASELPQVVVSAKGADVVAPEIVSGAFPVFASITLCVAEVAPGSTPPKLRLAGDSPAMAASGVLLDAVGLTPGMYDLNT
jgi:hypothetical protein